MHRVSHALHAKDVLPLETVYYRNGGRSSWASPRETLAAFTGAAILSLPVDETRAHFDGIDARE